MIRTKHHAYMAEVYQAVVDSYFAVVKPHATLTERVAFYSEVVRPALEKVGTAFHNMADRSEAAADLNATQIAAMAVYAQLIHWMETEMPVVTGYNESAHRAEIMDRVKKVLLSG